MGRRKYYVLIVAVGLTLWVSYCWIRYHVSDTRIDECFDLLAGVQQNICIRNAMESRDDALIWAIGLPVFCLLFLVVPSLIFRTIGRSRDREVLGTGKAEASLPRRGFERVEPDEQPSREAPLSAREFLDQFGSRVETFITEDDEPEELMAEILADAERAGIIDARGSIRTFSPLAFVMDVFTENPVAYDWAQSARIRVIPSEIEDREQLLDIIWW